MSVIARLHQYDNTVTSSGPDMEEELDQLINTVNNLDNTNLNASAGIKGAQIATGANGIGTANVVDKAITSAKLANDAAVDASRAVDINHIKDLAVTLPAVFQVYTHGVIIHLDATDATKLTSTGLSGATYTPVGLHITGVIDSYAVPLLEVSGGLIQIRVNNTSRINGVGGAQINIGANVIKILYIKTARS